MSIKSLFEKIGAPLKGSKGTCGAVRPDGVVFLRVWQDEVRKINGAQYVRITAHQDFQKDLENFGYKERLEHVELIRQGAKCYFIICIAVDASTIPRKVGSAIEDDVFEAGDMIEHMGDSWVRLVKRHPVRFVLPASPVH